MLKAAVASLFVAHSVAENVDYFSWRVFDVFPANDAVALELRALEVDGLDWQPICVGAEHSCQAALPAESVAKFVSFLEVAEVAHTELNVSLGQMFANERARMDAFNELMAPTNWTRSDFMQENPWDLEFHDYDATAKRVQQIAAENPGVTTLLRAGTSTEGRPIFGLRIGLNAAAPKIAFDGCIHAREWITTATVMYMINQMVDGFNGGDTDIIDLLNTVEFHIVPIVNVDGYQYSHGGIFNRMWRKTRSVNQGSTCIGTDPNRNSDSNFGGPGTSSNPCSDSYHGPAPFSEPEVAAMRDYLSGLTDLRLYNNIHSVANLLLSPYGYTGDLPADYTDHELCHARAASAIQAVNNNAFRYGPIYTAIYPAAGGLIDWIYDAGVAKYTAAWELGGGSFSPQPSFIVISGREIWAGMREHIDCVLENP